MLKAGCKKWHLKDADPTQWSHITRFRGYLCFIQCITLYNGVFIQHQCGKCAVQQMVNLMIRESFASLALSLEILTQKEVLNCPVMRKVRISWSSRSPEPKTYNSLHSVCFLL